VLNSRWAVRLGECSYALYLLHPSVIAYFSIVARHMRIDGPAVYVVFAATLAVSLYLSTVVFDQIEEPARRWLRRREHAKLTRAAGTAGVL